MDVVDILKIPVGNPMEKDDIIWNENPKGQFLVKSVYHLATLSKLNLIGDRSETKISPRAKICFWKIVNKTVPSKANIMMKKKVTHINSTCCLYMKLEENTSHVICKCKFVRSF